MLTEEYILLADLVISKMTLGQSTSIHIMLRSILSGEYNNYDPETYKKMADIIKTSDAGFGKIRKHLLDEGYIEEADKIPRYRLKEKGKIAGEKGDIKHTRNGKQNKIIKTKILQSRILILEEI